MHNGRIKYNHIVSLGKDCMSRTIPTKFFLKKNKNDGELSLPFDLAIHRYDAVCEIIENEFLDYTNSKYFQIGTDGSIEHSKYFARYTHERESIFYEENFKHLIEKYFKRIANFNSYIQDDCILFIATFPVYPIELFNVIKSTYPSLRFKLLNFDTREFSASNNYRVDGLGLKNKDLLYVRAPIPHSNYIWWKKEDYDTPEGKEFESYIAYWVELMLEFGI